MATNPPQIECYLLHTFDSVRSIQVSENGVAYTTLTLTATATVADALADWQAQANGVGGWVNTYTFSITAENVITFAADGNFWLELDHSADVALGFSAASFGPILTTSSDLQPACEANPIGVDYDVPEVDEQVLTIKRRWGRVTPLAHYRHRVQRLRVMMTTAMSDVLLRGPMFAGRIRIYTSADTANPYDLGNADGYLDLWPYKIEDAEPLGVADGHTEVSLVAGVEDV